MGDGIVTSIPDISEELGQCNVESDRALLAFIEANGFNEMTGFTFNVLVKKYAAALNEIDRKDKEISELKEEKQLAFDELLIADRTLCFDENGLFIGVD